MSQYLKKSLDESGVKIPVSSAFFLPLLKCKPLQVFPISFLTLDSSSQVSVLFKSSNFAQSALAL